LEEEDIRSSINLHIQLQLCCMFFVFSLRLGFWRNFQIQTENYDVDTDRTFLPVMFFDLAEYSSITETDGRTQTPQPPRNW